MRRAIIIDLALHLFSTALFSVLIMLTFRSLLYVRIFVAGSIFIDLDHLVDYFLYFKNHFHIKKFLGLRFLDSGKVYIFLHSWELVFLVLLAGIVFKSTGILIFFAGLTTHLIIDSAQRKNILCYLLIYRYIHNFDAKIILPEHLAGGR